MVTKGGKTHNISKVAYNTVSAMGEDFIKKIIRKAKFLMQNQPNVKDNKNVTLGPRHIIAAANALKVPGEITEDAIARAKRQAYDNKTFKKSSIHRKMAAYGGKHWVKKDSNKYLWCIVITLLEEIFTQAIAIKGDDKARITSQNVYRAIKNHPDALLTPFASYISDGVAFI